MEAVVCVADVCFGFISVCGLNDFVVVMLCVVLLIRFGWMLILVCLLVCVGILICLLFWFVLLDFSFVWVVCVECLLL